MARVTVVTAPPPAQVIAKRKIKPTPKVSTSKASEAGSSQAGSTVVSNPPSVIAPTPRKRDAVDLLSDGPSSSKVPRTTFSPIVPRREASQSSGRSIAPPTAPPSPYDPVMLRLDSLTDSLRQSHEENLRRMEFSFNENLRRLAELREYIVEDRVRNTK